MSIEKKFSDVDGHSDTLEVAVWSKGLRGEVSFLAEGEEGDAYVTVDVHEFKAWFDQAYAEVFGRPQREDVAHVLMTSNDESGWGIPWPIAIYTDAIEASEACRRERLNGGEYWLSTVPINPHFFNREDQA